MFRKLLDKLWPRKLRWNKPSGTSKQRRGQYGYLLDPSDVPDLHEGSTRSSVVHGSDEQPHFNPFSDSSGSRNPSSQEVIEPRAQENCQICRSEATQSRELESSAEAEGSDTSEAHLAQREQRLGLFMPFDHRDMPVVLRDTERVTRSLSVLRNAVFTDDSGEFDVPQDTVHG